jgi:hypothetical protein
MSFRISLSTSAPALQLGGEEIHDIRTRQEIVMTRPTSADREPPTTDETIALANLHAQISGLAAHQSRICVGGGPNCLPRCHAIAGIPHRQTKQLHRGDCRRER